MICFIGQLGSLQAQEMTPKDLKEKTLLVMKWEEKDPEKINKYDYNNFIKFNEDYNYEPPYKKYCKKYIKIANKNIENYNKILEEEMKKYPYKYKLVTEKELNSIYSDRVKYPYVLTKFYIENHVRWTSHAASPQENNHDAVSYIIRLFIYDRSSEKEYDMFPKGKLARLKKGFNTTYQNFISTVK